MADTGEKVWYALSRFVPVEDEAPAVGCLCGLQYNGGVNQRCPEHGRRCHYANCDQLCAGDAEWQWRDSVIGPMRRYCSKECFAAHRRLAAAPPVAESKKASMPCKRCGVPRSMPCGLCADCDVLEQVRAASVDPYRAHTNHRTDAEMLEHERLDRANTDNRSEAKAARFRNIAALRAEFDIPTSDRRLALAKRFGGRASEDWGCFSTATEES